MMAPPPESSLSAVTKTVEALPSVLASESTKDRSISSEASMRMSPSSVIRS